ncbi:Coiled-coil-helix-coiled-coil-helix domain-containing protein 2 [Sarcoptes scabiei]|uniref:Coiled-coil-helix-coiled-coil-helix domain-containing protein 2 n=1 Tax=Sarcoptes scabiei TaxID=52283 RepID=A0A834R3G0_SARSC|nr:Coiled-coil-helix-coiled-coil-helix domain-containing protein 2 [Sarcoptes scabiei]UXI20317.1 phosphoglycerate kinase [Sarcoptes scabiei]
MPRRTRSSPSPSRGSPFSGGQSRMASSRSTAPQLPARQQPAAVAPAPAPSQGPGLLGQMAATAGGVAIGSAVGHTIGHAITGAMSGSGTEPVQSPQAQQAQMNQQQQLPGPCQFELQQFLECTQNYDLNLCEGFNEVLKQCRLQNPSVRF